MSRMRSGMCEIGMHKECKPASALYCDCRCHNNEGSAGTPDVRGELFGFTKRGDGQVVLLVEDDESWFPIDVFSPFWLMDLGRTALKAAQVIGKICQNCDHEDTNLGSCKPEHLAPKLKYKKLHCKECCAEAGKWVPAG